jgi:hypothetical protein
VIAKEARIQVDRFYSKEDLDEFTEVFSLFFNVHGVNSRSRNFFFFF